MRLIDHHPHKLQEPSSAREWRYVAPTPRRAVAIAMWKDEPLPAQTTPLWTRLDALLLVLVVAMVTVLSGIGLSMLYDHDTALNESDASNVHSDPRLLQLLQAHRTVVVSAWSSFPISDSWSSGRRDIGQRDDD